MNPKFQLQILFYLTVFLPSSSTIAAVCNSTCGGYTVPFPFGFSPSCPIPLNCSSSPSLASIFPIQSITSDAILVSLPAACGRPIDSLRRLFTLNYAPTSLNAILLQNCTTHHHPTSCFLPKTMATANFRLINCDRKNGPKSSNGNTTSSSISCYSEVPGRRRNGGMTGFLDYGKMMRRSGCRFLLSAISSETVPAVSLDVGVVRMEWWVLGECGLCSRNARCVRVTTWMEENPAAYRCRCLEGLVGDGFHGGVGCRKGTVVILNVSCCPILLYVHYTLIAIMLVLIILLII